MRKLLRSGLLLVAMSSVMYGDHSNNNMLARRAPAIDPNSAIAAVFLLSSRVLMMIRGYRKK